ncbi:Uncharacterized conserved protein YegP, UPF0339 family [Arthrobacter sp. ov407]|uniref:YegP family protein n=1 Tax=Arthrobacter sp. ov407 TaxID=1761748 RepID=UPI00087F0415|nr:Uncharacterized conserved protein YegP, UPF0339 family [Arthrobacter sp. ov407]
MTGMFELFTDSDASYRFRLTAPDGTVIALSRHFPDLPSAVEGIAAVREYAGMGLVTEIEAPQGDALLRQSRAENIPVGASTQNRRAHEAHAHETHPQARSGRDGASGSRVRPPRLRIPSAARFLGGRAVARNRQLIVRWRQTLEPRTAQAGLSSC